MATEDPFEKIVELTNDLEQARKEAQQGRQYKGQLDSLTARHQSLLEDLGRAEQRVKNTSEQLRQEKIDRENAQTGQRAAELNFDELRREFEKIQAAYNDLEQERAGQNRADAEVSAQIDELTHLVRAQKAQIQAAQDALNA